MQDMDRNELLTAASMKELEEKIPPDSRGPRFSTGAIVIVEDEWGSRYRYRVTGLKRNRLFLKPHGREEADDAE